MRSDSKDQHTSKPLNNPKVLDVGCGTDKVQGAIGIDIVDLPGADLVHDLNEFPWPFNDEEFDVIYMNDIIEYLNNTIKVMEECYRLLKPGGKLHIRVVYWNHKYAFSDPTHVKAFTENSFDFFIGKHRAYYIKANFEMEKMEFIYDERVRRVLRSKRFMNFLSRFLCNIKQGISVILVKK